MHTVRSNVQVRNCLAETRALVTLSVMMKHRSVELPKLHRSSPSIHVTTQKNKSGMFRFVQLANEKPDLKPEDIFLNPPPS